MNWLSDLFINDSIAHTVLMYALVISGGVLLGRIRIFGVSLGITFVLFAGILIGHLGFSVNQNTLDFVKDFGLILFVYSIGLQVGPGFFSSFREGGLRLNLLACGVVLLNVILVILIWALANGRVSMPIMVGIMSGAVTNTPGLGAAQQALNQLFESGQISSVPPIALGYAVAYPLGVVGIILSMIFIRMAFRINPGKEQQALDQAQEAATQKPNLISLMVKNKAMFGRSVSEVVQLVGRSFVVSRMMKGDQMIIPASDTLLEENDRLLVAVSVQDALAVQSFIGEEISMDWKKASGPLVSRQILITKNGINGKHLGFLKIRNHYGVNITRIHRAGVDLLANPDLVLQIGDKVTVVGEIDAISRVETLLGNSLKRLNEPNIVTIFAGILLGILLGSIPFYFPGMPMPVKLGLAGGPLIVAILMGRFGHHFKFVTYTTQSANWMLREVGIALFLASVGLGAGGNFVNTVISGDGLLWVGYGFMITIVPLLIIGCIARFFYKTNYYTVMGLLAGSTTDPPALAYSNAIAGNDAPAVAYSTVYPLTMFLRVLAAQLLILFFT